MTEDQLQSLGLKLPPGEMARLVALVADLDKAAAMLRGPRPYAEEPLSTFRLPHR